MCVCIIFSSVIPYSLSDALQLGSAFYGPGIGSVLLDEVRCIGTERRLIDCPHASTVSCYYGHSQDVGVRCQSKLQSIRNTPPVLHLLTLHALPEVI